MILALDPEALAGLHDRTQRVVACDDTAHVDAWEQSAPSRVAEPGFTERFRRAGRLAASPSAAAQLWDRVLCVTDLEEQVREIQAPVLMITRRGYAEATGTSLEKRQELLDDMPNGVHLVLEGGDLIPNAGDIDGLIFEIAEFLHGGAPTAFASRPVTTILFTDLVGSTTVARELGDADWRAVLDHHDHLIERTVRRHGGTIVKTTGDGALTPFYAPSRALRCALALRDAMVDLDIGMRMGLHLGEVEGRGTDVAQWRSISPRV